jgi:hypothetical protein
MEKLDRTLYALSRKKESSEMAKVYWGTSRPEA